VVFLRILVVIMNWQNRPFTGERTVAASSRPNGKPSKSDCFIRFDDVSYWHSRTRDLIANAGTYSYPAFRESFRELRREARKSEMQLVITLFQFEKAMRREAADDDKE
jgi:hypothetical protein